jgi:glycosyltransferase involved in cell wall biosynthesis
MGTASVSNNGAGTGAKKIFIVIPAYQAEATIGQVFDRIPKELDAKDVTTLVVNDGSSDRTAEVVKEIMARQPRVQLIDHDRNRGYAQAQKTGFAFALEHGAEIVALLHADGQYAPELLPELLAPLEADEADVVQGSRILGGAALKGGMPMYKYIANRSLTALENFAYGLSMGEYHSGYMLYSRKALDGVPFDRLSDTFHFDGEMILVSAKRKMRIKQIGIPTHYGEERSHLKPIRYGVDVLKVVVNNALGRYDF